MGRIRGRNNRAVKINHDTFDFWTRNNAWVLGLLTADGSIGGKARPQEFKLYSTDLELLEAVKSVFQSEKKIYVNQGVKGRLGKKPVGSLFISSNKMMNFFREINAVGNKDIRNPFPFIPDEYKWSFIKGLFDGDGNGYKGHFAIAGRELLIEQVYHWICRQIGKKPNKLYKSTSTNKTVYFQMGKADSAIVLAFIEKEAAGTYSSEKYKRFGEILAA